MTPLFEALRRRDPAAWDEFYHAHLREIYGFLARLVSGDPAAADDLFQETWLEALDAIDQYDPARGELRAWLFGIARRRAALYWRRRLTRPGTIDSDSLEHAASNGALLPDFVMEQVEQAVAVQAA